MKNHFHYCLMKFKNLQFPEAVVILAVRYYCAYKLSYRNIEEIFKDRNIILDHSTINRWVIKFSKYIVNCARKYTYNYLINIIFLILL